MCSSHLVAPSRIFYKLIGNLQSLATYPVHIFYTHDNTLHIESHNKIISSLYDEKRFPQILSPQILSPKIIGQTFVYHQLYEVLLVYHITSNIFSWHLHHIVSIETSSFSPENSFTIGINRKKKPSGVRWIVSKDVRTTGIL